MSIPSSSGVTDLRSVIRTDGRERMSRKYRALGNQLKKTPCDDKLLSLVRISSSSKLHSSRGFHNQKTDIPLYPYQDRNRYSNQPPSTPGLLSYKRKIRVRHGVNYPTNFSKLPTSHLSHGNCRSTSRSTMCTPSVQLFAKIQEENYHM